MQFHHPHLFRQQVADALQAEMPEIWEGLLAAGAVPTVLPGQPGVPAGLHCRRITFERVLRAVAQAEFAQVELARPAGRYSWYDSGAFGQHVREGGYRRPGRLPPGRHRCSGSARPRRRTGRNPGTRRFPCLKDARAYAGHRDRVLAVARAEPQQAVQQVTKPNWSASTTRTYNRLIGAVS